jgi:hypothetical protein
MRAGDSSEQLLADRTSATVGSPMARAEATARPVGLRGEQVMTDREHLTPFGAESAQVRSCWMCGIRLPVSQMVPDGGSACHDVRWYCSDTWGCTQRWTSHPARLTAIRPDVAEPVETPDEDSAGLVAASPSRSISPIISLPRLSHGVIYTVGMAMRGSPLYRSLASHSLVGYFALLIRMSCA